MENGVKNISMKEYNYLTVFGRLDNPIILDCVIKYLILPHMYLDEISRPNKISNFTTVHIIYVASGKFISNLNTPSGYLHDIILTYNFPITVHTIIREKPGCAKEKRLY